MIQEKDFLYRVPVKNALVATPGQQVRNPEILVDLEGGEFMRGNMLDANSTNKLINQSVKDAVDDKLIESGYVTQDLLDAETSARTKGDEDLSAKIQAEQTRAEGKEKEISDKLAIVDGDSNTEGSFRKAIADVVAAAPEDLDTLKEIADKLAGNDDLHTALNQAITEKADTSALLNEVSRATGAESGLQAAIATKQEKGNYIPYDESDEDYYAIDKALKLGNEDEGIMTISSNDISYLQNDNSWSFGMTTTGISGQFGTDQYSLTSDSGIGLQNGDKTLRIDYNGLAIKGGNANFSVNPSTGIRMYTQDNESYSNIDLPGLRSKVRDTVYANFTSSNFIDIRRSNCKVIILPEQILATDGIGSIFINQGGLKIVDNAKKAVKLTSLGVTLPDGDNNHVLTSNGSTIDITQYIKKTELPTVPTKTSELTNDSNFITAADIDLAPYATTEALTAVDQKIATKQDKIVPKSVDITDIETADISKLRTIVSNLLDALSLSGLIKQNVGL